MRWNRRLFCAAVIVGLGLTALTSAHALGTEDFKITIYREYQGKKCTSGYLAVNGKIIAYTLERPWADNQQNISSIPAGTYNSVLRYDHDDHWRIELLSVPGAAGKPPRTHVQIHVGNQPDDTKGCILVGKRLSNDLCSIVGGTSKPAYAELKNAFYGSANPNATPDKTIIVEIVDPGPQSKLDGAKPSK